LAKGAWQRLSVPVICVGNINVGGTGKTPTVIALQSLLQKRGIDAHVVSRGYGGREIGPLKVQERLHKASQVGDEPLLMSAFGPVWVAKDRFAGAKAAISEGAKAILLDDGFQNPAIQKDLSIVVIDAEIGFGNARVMPAGPLRETIKSGLARADLVISIGAAAAQKNLAVRWPEINNVRRLEAHLEPLDTGMNWHGLRAIAFAGIARPAKFFASLRSAGAEIIASHEFADHAAFPKAVLRRLAAEASKNSGQLVTTEKDAARLPLAFRSEVLVFPVRLAFHDQAALNAIIDELFA